MNLSIKQIAENFSKHNFETTFPYLLDNIEWNMVGGELTIGKENVIKNCNQSSEYLKTTQTTFTKFLILESENYVTVDTVSEYIDKDKTISKVASCDIYKFNQGQLVEITSYCVELK